MDLNGDGKLDIISGNGYGRIYFSLRKENSDFTKPKELVDRDGNMINLGRFLTKVGKDGRTLDLDKSVGTSDSLLYPLMADWDNDGDLDIILGGYNGTLAIRKNEGTSTKAAFATKNIPIFVDEKELKFKLAVCPAWADWDNDGLHDLICSSWDGQIKWYKNIGTKTKPKFTTGGVLLEKGVEFPNDEMKIVGGSKRPISMLKITVTDYNGDKKPDLVIGAYDKKGKAYLWLYQRK